MGRARRWTVTSLFLAFAFLVAVPYERTWAQEGQRVGQIVFKGNRQYGESTLKFKIQTKEGQRYSEAKLAEDASTLLAFFEQVTTKVEPMAGGVRIVFLVVEHPNVLTSVIFRGFRSLKEEDYLPEVFTKVGYPFAEFMVQQDRQRLVEMLKAKGYYFAEVQVAAGDFAGGKQVVFTALEGPEVEVDEIRFVGIQAFEEDVLRDRMLLDEGGFLTSYEFVEQTLRQDIVSVLGFYRSEGYLDAVVELRDLSFSPDKEEVTITIGVMEGERYMVSAVEVKGGDTFPGDRSQLEALVRIVPGAPRRDEEILLTREAIRKFYLENAYYDAQVGLDADDDSVEHSSVIRFLIREGSPARIRRLDIAGNTATREDVIRRSLSVFPGGPLNSIEIQKSVARLDATRYFDEKRGVGARILDTDEPGVKDVLFSVSEGTTGSIRFSMGLTSDLGVLGLIQLTKNNFDYADLPEKFSDVLSGRAFTGGGQRLEILASPGSSFSQYRLKFNEPWFLDEYVFYGPSEEVEESAFGFGFDIFHTILGRFNYDERRTGVSVSTGKRWRKPGREIDDVFSWGLGFTWENVRYRDVESDAAPNIFIFDGMNEVHKLRMDLGWDHVDVPASPGEGWRLFCTYTLGGGPLGGEVDFHKFEARTTNFFTIYTTKSGQRHILEIQTGIGYATDFGDSDQVPPFERFLLGGGATVRGFGYGEVGPRAEGDPLTEEGRDRIRRSMEEGKGDPLGGQGMWLAKVEYGFPILEDILRGVVFLDAGNVSDTWSGDLWGDFRAAAGIGVRVKIPFIGPTPIALDFAFPIREEKGDDSQVLSFSFDRPF